MLTPRTKLLVALACGLAALGISLALGASLTSSARLLLGGLAVAAALWWFSRRGTLGFAATPRLTVVQRAGLSARTGLALIEVDGRSYLVVHGEGFARLTTLRTPKSIPSTRARVSLELPVQSSELRS